MKGKLKQTKGITLIALIITIIILLILAVVSIRLVMNSGIISKAEKGVDEYSQAEANEQAQLLKSEYEMAKYDGKFSGTYEEYAVEKLYGVKIGDYVAYNEAGFGDYTTDTTKGIGGSVGTKDATTGKYPLNSKIYTTENLGWRVLGVNDKGELELISDNPMSEDKKVYLANEEGYLYGPDELDIMCNKLYGNGTDSNGKVVATEARSLNVEDINKLIDTGYDPKTYSGYGTKWTYRFPTSGNYMQYKTTKADGTLVTDWKDITNLSYQTFRLPGESKTIRKDNKKTSEPIEYTFYYYTVSDKVKQTTSDGKSMADIITKGTDNTYDNQWLASSCVYCSSDYARFGVRFVDDEGLMRYYSLFYSYNSSYGNNCRVRPVVSLKSDIQIEKTDVNDGSTLAKACIIK